MKKLIKKIIVLSMLCMYVTTNSYLVHAEMIAQPYSEGKNTSAEEKIKQENAEVVDSAKKESTEAVDSIKQENTETIDKTKQENVKDIVSSKTPESAFTVSYGRITDYDVSIGGTDVVIPSVINGETITTIYDSAFARKGITSVSIPNTVQTIDRLAFAENPNLTSVQLSEGLIKIGGSAFKECGIEGNLVIPNTVTKLESYAFYGNKIDSVTIGNSLEYIESYAFGYNSISILNLGNTKRIGNYAFSGNQISNLTIPSSVTRIDRWAFSSAGIEQLNLSEGLTNIGEWAFARNNFRNLVLPDSATIIEKNAFAESNIENVKVGAFLTEIRESVFASNNISTLDLANVEIIGEGAFASNNLSNLTISSSVKNIGKQAFVNANVEKIDGGENLQIIGENAFQGNNIKKLNIPSKVESIGNYAFYGNPIGELKISDSVQTIGNSAFENQWNSQDTSKNNRMKLDLGNGVKSIGQNAFSGNYMSPPILPSSLTTVGNNAFLYCDISYIELNATNPRIYYGRQVKDRKLIKVEKSATEITVNLTELYPGIDPQKINITKVKYGISTSDSNFNYDSQTGELTFDANGTSYSTIYYNYVIDGITVLSVEQKLDYGNIYTATWKDWDGAVIQEDKYERRYVDPEAVAVPPANPTRPGYTFSTWSRNPSYGGPGGQFILIADTVFTANYIENDYVVEYDLDYQGAATISPQTFKWSKTGINKLIPKRVGYTFDGWYYNGKKVEDIDSVSSIVVNDPGAGSTITLQAKWRKPASIPVITANDVSIKVGDPFDPIKDTNVSAFDAIDGRIPVTKDNIIFYDVQIDIPGTYNVTYQVKNKEGAIAEKTIKVVVIPKDVVDVEGNGEWGVVIPMSINFTKEAQTVDADIKLVGLGGTNLSDFKTLEVDGTVKSENAYKMIGEGNAKDNTASYTYQLNNNNEFAANKSEQPISRLNLTAPKQDGIATLTNGGSKKGKYKDMLTFKFTAVKVEKKQN